MHPPPPGRPSRFFRPTIAGNFSWKRYRYVPQFKSRTRKGKLRHHLRVTPFLILVRNADKNPSSETSPPLATSSLALRSLNPRRSLWSLSHSTLKFMRSTSGKSSTVKYLTVLSEDNSFYLSFQYSNTCYQCCVDSKKKKKFKIIDRLHQKTVFRDLNLVLPIIMISYYY